VRARARVLSGFLREVCEICALMGRYAANCGNSLPAFPNHLSVPSSRVKEEGCSELLGRNYHHTLRNIAEER